MCIIYNTVSQVALASYPGHPERDSFFSAWPGYEANGTHTHKMSIYNMPLSRECTSGVISTLLQDTSMDFYYTDTCKILTIT